MPHLSTKASHENLKKQTETVLSLLTVLRSMDKNTGPPLYTLLHEKNINLCSVLETLIKSSDSEVLRQRICDLGVLQVIADLLKQPIKPNDNASSIETRYHACTLLTNLSVGNIENKKLIISIDGLINGLLSQLRSSSEELQRMAAGVLRNLSLNADEVSKKVLKNSGIIPALLSSAMMAKEESTLECLLTALWNVSGHSEENKKDICEYRGSLKFIVSLLVKDSSSIVENGGGILKNVSSYITIHKDLRQILRENKCFEILLKHLKSPNPKIVSNACGTLWNLSARCSEDQLTLLDLGAVATLGQLVTSEHEAISMASSAALKNLVSFRMNFSASSNFNPELEKQESKRMMHHTSHNQTHQAQLKAPQTLGNLHPKVCEYEESLDEFIDFSGRYKEFHEQPHICQSKSNIEGVNSSYSPFSYEHVIPKGNHAMHNNFLMGNNKNTNKVQMKNNGGSLEVAIASGHLQDIFQACKQDFMPMSPPELPKHYCTEDTPDGQSVYNSSVNNISDFASLEIGRYQNIAPGQMPLAGKGLIANNPIYKESVSSSPKEIPREYYTEDTPDRFSRGSSLSSLSMKSLENVDQKKIISDRVEQSVGLPCINENETLNITSNVSKSAVNKFKLCSQDGIYGVKAVTFDETPLMFSRSSSLASLNSFDAHSVHSSLVSEYSRRASSVVSPSELPNSPGESPPSPQQSKMCEVSHSYESSKPKDDVGVKHQLSFCKTNEDKDDCLSDNEDENANQLLRQVMRAAMPKDEKRSKAASRINSANTNNLKPFYLKESPHPKPCFITPSTDITNDASFSDTMKTYAVEGTPLELSRSASLSILTIDDSLIKKVGDKSESYFMRFDPKRDDMDSCDDSVHAYCTERTPITFSRNESLSPLCSKDSPAKLVDSSFDVHPQSNFLLENSKPFQCLHNVTTSTPSNKALATSCEQISYDIVPLESSRSNKDEVNCTSKSFKNLMKEFDVSTSSSSSFSCSSDESNDSVDNCIEIAMPKCKEGRKKPIFAGLERKSCEGSSLNHTRDLSKRRNSKHEKSSFSEDEDTEVNNTVIYKGPQEVLLREEMSPKNEKIDKHNNVNDLIEDFPQKASIQNLKETKYLVNQVQHLKGPQTSLNAGNDATSLAPIDASSSTLEKKNSKNRLTNFFLRYSMGKKKNPQKPSTSKDNKKFRLSIKKSHKSHHKKTTD